MKKAPIPENDAERVSSLERMHLLSTSREGDLDRITRTAQKIFDTEIALVSLVDEERQWFKSRVGLDAQETGRDISFCGHAIMGDESFVVVDPQNDERFHDNPLVTGGPEIRFYAGQPLTNEEGHRIGTLCVISQQQKEFAHEDQQTLRDLGRMVEVILENRHLSETQEVMLQALGADQRDGLIDAETGLWNEAGFDEFFQRELQKSQKDETSFCVALCEIKDNISEAASILSDQTKTCEYACRMSENTFALILPETDLEKIEERACSYYSAFERRAPESQVSFGWLVVDSFIKVGNFKSSVLELCEKALKEASDSSKRRLSIKIFQIEIINSL